MTNTPTIKTERLILRKFKEEDSEAFREIMKDKEVNTFLPLFPLETIAQAKDYLQKNYLDTYWQPTGFRYAICLNDSIPIGYVNIAQDDSYDLGYGLRKEFWGKGITTEACKALIGQLMEAGIPYITATHDINNPASGHIMKKIGMQYCYSYDELWQPKNFLVTFRMYQLNFSAESDFVYKKYWNKYPAHRIENNV